VRRDRQQTTKVRSALFLFDNGLDNVIVHRVDGVRATAVPLRAPFFDHW